MLILTLYTDTIYVTQDVFFTRPNCAAHSPGPFIQLRVVLCFSQCTWTWTESNCCSPKTENSDFQKSRFTNIIRIFQVLNSRCFFFTLVKRLGTHNWDNRAVWNHIIILALYSASLPCVLWPELNQFVFCFFFKKDLLSVTLRPLLCF